MNKKLKVCMNCKYSDYQGYLLCKRNAPVVQPKQTRHGLFYNNESVWPSVMSMDHCGEFKIK